MSRPTQRILGVLELLQARGRISGSELARGLEVDPRSVRRYISRLEQLGVPITAERGRDGAYRLLAGFKVPPMMFSDDEAIAISIGLLAARGLGMADAASAVASAQAKLERVMPASLKRRVSALRESVVLEQTRPAAMFDNANLVALGNAAHDRVSVHIRYRSHGRAIASERDFDAYGVVAREGRWYVVGYCHLRRGLRSFRLDRVMSVHPLPAYFVRPAGFDALEHLKKSAASLPRVHAIEVLLKTDLHTAQRELFSAFGVLEAHMDGVLLRSQADNLEWVAQELARLPFAFEIRAPQGLNDAMIALANRLLASSTG